MKLDIPYLMKNLTLEEKASLCSGLNFWWTKPVERLGVPGVMVTDGPHGLRKQDSAGDNLGINQAVEAVCFPSGAAFASAFDRELIYELGRHLGEAAAAEKVHTLLGPAVNIKRSPLCGRNFEYLSEDPYLAGQLAASYIKGVQSRDVGVSVKHFAANNQEYCRMSTDTRVSRRALREIYLPAFETAVKEGHPWTLMCAYNRLNGTYCCENEWLLHHVLRQDWGFDGIVMTDWGAMNDRVRALEAGLELEMPSSNGVRDAEIVRAVRDGRLSMEILDRRVESLLRWLDKGLTDHPDSYDKEEHNTFARTAAAKCAVLLKNEEDLLPLRREDEVLFVGPFAQIPRYQGGGSSHITVTKVTGALDALTGAEHVTWLPGWGADNVTADPALRQEALEAAKKAKAVVVFAGLPDSYESEGYDRSHLDLPECQNELIEALAEVNPNVAVVLHAGSVVLMPWADRVKSILHMYLGGQAVGGAEVDLIFGDAEPTGRLAETYPLRLEDTPAYLGFPGTGRTVTYGEGVFVGYRWYDSRRMPVRFPFGHGLSYTTFAMSGLTLSREEFDGEGTVAVSVKVKNTGKRPGHQVVQVYVAPPAESTQGRPVHELRAFEKVFLEPGEEKTVTVELGRRAFTYWEEELDSWRMEGGAYTVEVGVSSRDLPLKAALRVADEPLPFKYRDSLTVNDVLRTGREDVIGPDFWANVGGVFGGSAGDEEGAVINRRMLEALLGDMPLHSILSYIPTPEGFLQGLRDKIDKKGEGAM